MTIHLCRDFLTLPSSPSPATSMYLVTLFLINVMTYVNDASNNVNFDIGSSSYLAGAYDAVSNDLQYGSINVGVDPYYVWVPASAYTTPDDGGDRIIALRSEANPTFNSGLFRIIGVATDPDLGTGLKIDYRSSEEPPSETGTLAWRIYESELVVASLWNTGSNGSTGYNSNGDASCSRIMLTSPGGLNVRLSLESPPDRLGTVPCGFTIAPGFGPTDRADFNNVDPNLHGPMWFNTTSSLYRGTAVGLSPSGSVSGSGTGQWRFTAVGDDDLSGSVALFTRNVTFTSGGTGWCVFGLPEDEPKPTSSRIIDRAFIIGYGNAAPNLTWHSGFFNDRHAQGIAWSQYGFPMPVIMSSYCDIRNLDPHVRSLTTAIDTPFLGLTELSDVDLLGGVMTSSQGAVTSRIVPFAQQRLGRLPLARQGRSNYTQWATTPDKQWLHTQDGIFVPWNGPFLTGAPVGSANVLLILTSSIADETGIQFFEPDPPMADPIELVLPPESSDHDATRYRKTYSYHRQQVVEVNVVKGGSNTPPPKR